MVATNSTPASSNKAPQTSQPNSTTAQKSVSAFYDVIDQAIALDTSLAIEVPALSGGSTGSGDAGGAGNGNPVGGKFSTIDPPALHSSLAIDAPALHTSSVLSFPSLNTSSAPNSPGLQCTTVFDPPSLQKALGSGSQASTPTPPANHPGSCGASQGKVGGKTSSHHESHPGPQHTHQAGHQSRHDHCSHDENASHKGHSHNRC
jgi:hypothetical protein